MLERIESSLVPGCQRYAFQYERAPYPFAVDSDLCVIHKSATFQLGYLLDGLHVSCVAPGTENHGNLGFGIHVGGSDQCPCGIAREGNEVNRDVLSSLSVRLT